MDFRAALKQHPLLAKHAAKILAFVRPTILVTPRKGKAADDKLGASRFGGEPDLPRGTAWPLGPGWDDDEVPMDFIAQLDLAAVAKLDKQKRLPPTGVLAFFVGRAYRGCRVIHGKPGAIARVPHPEAANAKKKSKSKPKFAGLALSAGEALPPPWSHFVSSKQRSASAWNPRTNVTGKGTTAIELAPDAHDAYVDLYTRWRDEQPTHAGLFGFERMMEDVQRTDEQVLLRVNYSDLIPYDFVELVSIYWLLTDKALAKHAFDKADVFCGSTI